MICLIPTHPELNQLAVPSHTDDPQENVSGKNPEPWKGYNSWISWSMRIDELQSPVPGNSLLP